MLRHGEIKKFARKKKKKKKKFARDPIALGGGGETGTQTD